MADVPEMTPEQATTELKNLEWSFENYSKIEECLKAGANPNVYKGGRSLLFVICLHLRTESDALVKKLLEAGADPNGEVLPKTDTNSNLPSKSNNEDKKAVYNNSPVYAAALINGFGKLKTLARYKANFLPLGDFLLLRFSRNPEVIAFIKETLKKQKEELSLHSPRQTLTPVSTTAKPEVETQRTHQEAEEQSTGSENKKSSDADSLEKDPCFELNWEQGPAMNFRMTHILKGSFKLHLRPYYFNPEHLTKDEKERVLKTLAEHGIIPKRDFATEDLNSGMNPIRKWQAVWVVGAERDEHGKPVPWRTRYNQLKKLKEFWKSEKDYNKLAFCLKLWKHKQNSGK